MAAAFTHILVLDFDGTVCLGDEPVYAYARLLDEALTGPDTRQPGLVQATVERFLSETDAQASDAASGAASAPELDAALLTVAGSVDGYEAAERLARSLGVADRQLSAAYTGSRDALAGGLVQTWAPAGLAELLRRLPASTRIVLVTNAPETGVTQQLEHLGLASSFHEIVTSAGKPARMGPALARLLEQAELADRPERLLSVGDIWRNDLAPAAALGCCTALIERLASPLAAPTFRAPNIERLYPAIGAWATTP